MSNTLVNNSTLGMTLQSLICKSYSIKPNETAEKQFKSSYDKSLEVPLRHIIKKVFKEINVNPVQCTTFEKSTKAGEKTLPYNFILKDGRTLSVKTNRKKNCKIAPNIVGQAGYDKLNYHFGHLMTGKIENRDHIKSLIMNEIHKALPIFVDYMFIADITVWIYQDKEGEFNYRIINREQSPELNFSREDLYFTRENEAWVESTTLKLKSNKKSLAEIQSHSDPKRTFKFRFAMDVLVEMLKETKTNNETLGITAEKAICDYFNLDREDHINTRSSASLEKEVQPAIEAAFTHLPKAIKHCGSKKGKRGGQSKSPYDFILEGKKTLSLKTNYGKMVCPPEVGQPGATTFMKYFSHLIDSDKELSEEVFKELVINKVHLMMPIYLKHLLDSDYLLWIFKHKDKFKYKILQSIDTEDIKWEKDKFSFTRGLDTWNESTTVKYKGITLGEFQFHRSRSSYKFRFNMTNLLKILETYKLVMST